MYIYVAMEVLYQANYTTGRGAESFRSKGPARVPEVPRGAEAGRGWEVARGVGFAQTQGVASERVDSELDEKSLDDLINHLIPRRSPSETDVTFLNYPYLPFSSDILTWVIQHSRPVYEITRYLDQFQEEEVKPQVCLAPPESSLVSIELSGTRDIVACRVKLFHLG